MCLYGGRMDNIPTDRLEVETEDATHAPKGHENTVVLTSWKFLGRGGQYQARCDLCGRLVSPERVGASCPGSYCGWGWTWVCVVWTLSGRQERVEGERGNGSWKLSVVKQQTDYDTCSDFSASPHSYLRFNPYNTLTLFTYCGSLSLIKHGWPVIILSSLRLLCQLHICLHLLFLFFYSRQV